MRNILKLLFIIPLALLIVLFAVANRQSVRLSLDPLSRDVPLYTLDVPLFIIVLCALGAGILVGGLAAWLAQGKNRKARRVLAREATKLREETQSLRSMASDAALTSLPVRGA